MVACHAKLMYSVQLVKNAEQYSLEWYTRENDSSLFLSARRLMWKPHRGSMQMTSIFPWRLFKGMKNSRKLKSTHETPSFLILSSKVCALQRGESAIVARRLTCAILEANGFYFPWLKGKPFQRSALQ